MMINQAKVSLLDYKAPGSFEETRFEKLHNVIVSSSDEGSVAIAHSIADLIIQKQKKNQNCILGLATGSSPLNVYSELVRLHKQEGLSFKNVITFNLDEYYPIKKEDIQSYYGFMHQNLFNLVDIKPENINIPNGDLKPDKLRSSCITYENKIVYISFEADGEADEKESEIEEKILPYNRSVGLPKIVDNSCPIFFDQNSYSSVDQKYFSPPPEA